MSQFLINGGVALHGEVRAAGAKNAALPIMAAAILASEPVCLHNVPQLDDVRTQTALLKSLGLDVRVGQAMPDNELCQARPGLLILETVDPRPIHAPEELVRRMRAGFCVLGPLLARRRKAVVPLPGGCAIGDRPVDLHLRGLAALGADLRLSHGCVVAEARRLSGADIDMAGPRGPTVTGTANILSAAVLARGATTIRHAAQEPEIVDLGRFLTALGAKIEGLGSSTLRIEGVEQLGGATHRLIADRIETATLLMAAAITGGSISLHGVVAEHLDVVLEKLLAAGCAIHIEGDRIGLRAPERLRAVDLAAEPYPGPPTDVQAQWTALMTTADGVSTVRDRVFGQRFLHVAELNRLGADIVRRGDAVVIRGVRRLEGAALAASDLRASAALVLAGLAADGQTTLSNIFHLDRGYQRLDEKLRRLGAQIHRTTGQTQRAGHSPYETNS